MPTSQLVGFGWPLIKGGDRLLRGFVDRFLEVRLDSRKVFLQRGRRKIIVLRRAAAHRCRCCFAGLPPLYSERRCMPRRRAQKLFPAHRCKCTRAQRDAVGARCGARADGHACFRPPCQTDRMRERRRVFCDRAAGSNTVDVGSGARCAPGGGGLLRAALEPVYARVIICPSQPPAGAAGIAASRIENVAASLHLVFSESLRAKPEVFGLFHSPNHKAQDSFCA